MHAVGAAIPAEDDLATRVASDVVLDVAGLRAGYGHVPVLHGVTLQLHEGEAVGIVGHNGIGKTTLLKTLMGLLPATAGAISIDGIDVTRMKAHDRSRLGLGYVPQGRGILPGADRARQPAPRVERRLGRHRSTRRSTHPRARCRASRRCSTARAARSRAASSRSSRSAAPHRRALAAAARRAVGRHPAVDRPGDRRDPRRPAQARQALAPRRRAEPRPRPRRRRPHRRRSSAAGSSARSTRARRRPAASPSCSAWERCGCRGPRGASRRAAARGVRCVRACHGCDPTRAAARGDIAAASAPHRSPRIAAPRAYAVPVPADAPPSALSRGESMTMVKRPTLEQMRDDRRLAAHEHVAMTRSATTST